MNVPSAQHAPLRGNLAVTSVPDVLQMLEAQGCEGHVRFETEIGHAEVEYHGGTIVSAKLAELEGKSALFRLLGIVDGTFEVIYEPTSERPPIVANVAQLVEDRAQRFAEWRRLSERAPSPWTVLRLTNAGRDELAASSLSADDQRVLGLVDGRRTMTDVIGESPLDAVEVLTALVKAIERGAIEVVPPEGEGQGEPGPDGLSIAPAPTLQTLDGVSLRKRTAIGLGNLDLALRPSSPPVATSTSPTSAGSGTGGTTEIRRIISIGGPSSSAPQASSASIPPPQAPQESGEVPSAKVREQLLRDGAGAKRARFVGRYELLCPIGRGGMGSVYLARLNSEGGFRRLFAIKLLRRHLLEDSAAAQRFLEEARLAGHIHHPNVVSVTDAGFHGSQPYLVMDYVEGASFKQLLSSHPHARPPERILPIVLEALAGLHAAHTLVDDDGAPIGIVHCDVSPENLLVGVDGICRLLDFGVAKSANFTRDRETVTRGKPGYLAPEQVLGAPVDRRADVFAMGVVLYNALTGIRLFDAPTVEETMQQVCIRRIEPPSTVGLRPTPALDFVCMRALDREPDRRFSSAEEMMIELRRIALREGLLASAMDIANWVKESVGRELAQRRLIVLEASRARPVAPTVAIPNPQPIPRGELQIPENALALARRGDDPSDDPPSGTMALPDTGKAKRRVLIAASALAALAVLVTLLWPNLVSRLFKMETDRIVAPPAGAAPNGTDLATSPKP